MLSIQMATLAHFVKKCLCPSKSEPHLYIVSFRSAPCPSSSQPCSLFTPTNKSQSPGRKHDLHTHCTQHTLTRKDPHIVLVILLPCPPHRVHSFPVQARQKLTPGLSCRCASIRERARRSTGIDGDVVDQELRWHRGILIYEYATQSDEKEEGYIWLHKQLGIVPQYMARGTTVAICGLRTVEHARSSCLGRGRKRKASRWTLGDPANTCPVDFER